MTGLILIADARQPSASRPVEPWRTAFARPNVLPSPADNPLTPEKAALGLKLFFDPRLSGNGKLSCATCHIPALGFADGAPVSQAGATGVALSRHTPTLWDLAWSPTLMWDGRAPSLEAQARLPMSHPDEMAGSPEIGAARIASDETYRRLSKAAFNDELELSGQRIVKALAAYERTIVSPPTRFDHWLASDERALSREEQRGFHLFTGKAQCVGCHSGFSFTDHAFHDIGLPGSDLGRGPVASLTAVDHAFKTPGLRELVWTAPYMHDGSLASLEEVVRHYESGGIARHSRSRDMPKPFTLSDEERSDLVAFLESLSSDLPPQPSKEPWIARPQPQDVSIAAMLIGSTLVSQKDKAFRPASIRVKAGSSVTILNDDVRTHNVRIADPRMNVNSGAQEPGETATLKFDRTGHFEAHCGIHPTMRLHIDVE